MNQAHAGHVVSGIAIVSAAVVLSFMFYAMSTPTPPAPPKTAAQLLAEAIPKKTDALNYCIQTSYYQHEHDSSSLSPKDQADIINACTNSIKQVTDAPVAAPLNATGHQ